VAPFAFVANLVPNGLRCLGKSVLLAVVAGNPTFAWEVIDSQLLIL